MIRRVVTLTIIVVALTAAVISTTAVISSPVLAGFSDGY